MATITPPATSIEQSLANLRRVVDRGNKDRAALKTILATLCNDRNQETFRSGRGVGELVEIARRMTSELAARDAADPRPLHELTGEKPLGQRMGEAFGMPSNADVFGRPGNDPIDDEVDAMLERHGLGPDDSRG